MEPSKWARFIATGVLSKAALLRPASVPNTASSDEAIGAWAECIDQIGAPRVNDLWDEAVTTWALSDAPDKMFTPYALKKAVLATKNRWESDPIKRGRLNEARYAERRKVLLASSYSPHVIEGMLEGIRENLHLNEQGASLEIAAARGDYLALA